MGRKVEVDPEVVAIVPGLPTGRGRKRFGLRRGASLAESFAVVAHRLDRMDRVLAARFILCLGRLFFQAAEVFFRIAGDFRPRQARGLAPTPSKFPEGAEAPIRSPDREGRRSERRRV